MKKNDQINHDGCYFEKIQDYQIFSKIYWDKATNRWVVARENRTSWIEPCVNESNGYWVTTWTGSLRHFFSLGMALGYCLTLDRDD